MSAVASSETRFPATPSLRVDGMRALVTGASKGLGRAAAIALAEAGAAVTLAARGLAEMEATVAGLSGRGLKARAVALDVTDRAAVRRVIAETGPFEILVNNAGTNIREPFLEVSDTTLDRLVALNITAAFVVAQAVVRGMVEAGIGGSIINMSSTNGHVAGLNRTVYTASKHAIEGLTKAMAYELGPKGIRVNNLCPTFFETPLTAGFLADRQVMESTLSSLPIGRIGQVEDLMGAVVFLASPAAAMITGASLLVDGGLLTH
ncbi:MAG: SDR family oxidoreductase [Acetobacteraceae bacterium]|nr:SDR family oxidoreductase [Acetobacteraceae bacterium]